MPSLRPSTPRLIALLAVAGAALAAPGTASAIDGDVYCVNAVTCPNDGIQATFEGSLVAAKANPGRQKILVGPNPTGSYVGAASYSTETPSNRIDIVGQGRPLFEGNLANAAVLRLTGAAQNSVEGVDVHVPALTGASGIAIENGLVRNVAVTGGPKTGLSRGIDVVGGNATLATSSVDLQTGAGVGVSAGDVDVFDSRLDAPTGIDAHSSGVTAARTRVHAGHTGVSAVGGGGVALHASEVTTSAPGRGVIVRDAPLTVQRTTIAGLGTPQGVTDEAVVVEALSDDAPLTIDGSLLAGHQVSVRRSSLNGDAVPVAISDSAWNRSTERLSDVHAPVTRSGFFDHDPHFVARAAGDLRLVGGDPAIDLNGGPKDALDEFDVFFGTDRDGDGDGVAVPDAGAFEYDGPPPPRAKDADAAPAPTRTPATEPRGATPPAGNAPPSGDGVAPQILSARLKQRGRRLRLRVKLSERATLRIRVVKRKGRRTVATKRLRMRAGAHTRRLKLSRRHVRALAKRREVLSIVAIDAAGNRSTRKVVRLRRPAL